MKIKSEPARLEETYNKNLRLQLKESLGFKNIMEVPKIEKIVVNVGVKEAVADSRVLDKVENTLASIVGQRPQRTFARKSIAGFKIREGMPIGVCVTLRKKRMFDFFDKLINLALPRVRDFQGVSTKLDGRGNYNLGVKEWNIFPEADSTGIEKIYGLNITIHTSAKDDAAGFELLKGFGVPFKKK